MICSKPSIYVVRGLFRLEQGIRISNNDLFRNALLLLGKTMSFFRNRKIRQAAAFLIAGMVSFSQSFAADWPMSEGGPSHLSQSHHSVPVNQPHVRWSHSVGGAVYASVIISGNTAFVAGHDKSLSAIRLQDGKLLWSATLGAPISATPAVSGQIVVAAAKDGVISAFDTDSGKSLWSFQTGLKILSSPVIDQSVVYFGSHDLNLYALRLKDGRVLWQHRIDDYKYGGLYASPSVDSEHVYMGAKSGEFRAISRKTGEDQWVAILGSSIYGPAVIIDDTLYVGSYDRNVYAVKKATGEILWKTQLDDWPMGYTVQNGKVYATSRSGFLYIIDADKGGIAQSLDLGNRLRHGLVIGANGLATTTISPRAFRPLAHTAFAGRTTTSIWCKPSSNTKTTFYR